VRIVIELKTAGMENMLKKTCRVMGEEKSNEFQQQQKESNSQGVFYRGNRFQRSGRSGDGPIRRADGG
jgi:hypothetical protein